MDVVYEDSLHDPAAVVRGFASIAGLTIDPTQQLATDLAVQRDAATAAVRERFERELAASGTMIPTTSHEQPSSVGGVRA